MSLRSLTVAACLAVASAVGFGGAAFSADHTSSSCFLARDWDGWKSPSPNVIYVRVGPSAVYQFELSSGSNQLQQADVHLVSRIWGTAWICSPLDLDLRLVDSHGVFEEPLIVKSITRLTPEQVAAIPAKFRP
ncbi:MAG TPA: hypothetical protein VMT68_03090 [Caulobacteraceae bacterium]|nr:hypothetical protein [Caulobacteraceae bacterium]